MMSIRSAHTGWHHGEARSAIRTHLVFGAALCAGLVVGLGGWAATAHLAGAIIAPATVVVDTDVKKVQHQSGGIIAQLNVQNGDLVKEGDVLIRLDDTMTGANLGMVTKTLDELSGRRARLRAEQEGASEIHFPEDLVQRAATSADAAQIISGEQKLFEARRAAQAGQEAQLRERVTQLMQEAAGLESQQKAKEQEIAYIQDELKGVESLEDRKLTTKNRVTALRRDTTRLEGERGQIISSIAQAKGKIAETELKIIQVGQDRNTEVLRDLREIDGRFSELMERKISAEDQQRRTVIRSPQSGIVHQLAVHTVGGVVGPGETLMLIVPQTEGLLVEAHVQPQNIDQIKPGQTVSVRFSAFDRSTTPQLTGKVSVISPDVTRDPRTNQSYFTIRIAIPDDELARLGGLKLIPGMPAEAHLQTQMRTVMSYLAKPLADQFSRALRQN